MQQGCDRDDPTHEPRRRAEPVQVSRPGAREPHGPRGPTRLQAIQVCVSEGGAGSVGHGGDALTLVRGARRRRVERYGGKCAR